MGRMGRRERKLKRSRDIEDVFARSRRIFSRVYKEKGQPISVLVARQTFDDMVASETLSIHEARDFLSDPVKVRSLLDKAQSRFVEMEVHANRALLEAVAKNTSTKNTVKLAIAVNAFFLLAASVTGPAVAKYLDPFLDRWLKEKLDRPVKEEPKREEQVPKDPKARETLPDAIIAFNLVNSQKAREPHNAGDGFRKVIVARENVVGNGRRGISSLRPRS